MSGPLIVSADQKLIAYYTALQVYFKHIKMAAFWQYLAEHHGPSRRSRQ